jgi:hypothetical protein
MTYRRRLLLPVASAISGTKKMPMRNSVSQLMSVPPCVSPMCFAPSLSRRNGDG